MAMLLLLSRAKHMLHIHSHYSQSMFGCYWTIIIVVYYSSAYTFVSWLGAYETSITAIYYYFYCTTSRQQVLFTTVSFVGYRKTNRSTDNQGNRPNSGINNKQPMGKWTDRPFTYSQPTLNRGSWRRPIVTVVQHFKTDERSIRVVQNHVQVCGESPTRLNLATLVTRLLQSSVNE